MQIDATHRMSALYNYSRSQKEAEHEAQKARNAHLWIVGILVSVVLGLIMIYVAYKDYHKKKHEEIEKLAIELESAKREYQDIQEELQRLKDKDYKKLIAEKEEKGKELKQTIEELADATGLSSAIDNLDDFELSKIVEVFRKKKDFRSDNPIPNKAEWRALEVQFSKDMPSAYKTLAKDKKLSPLELHVCMLLILDFEDSSIVNLTDSISQTITTAKSRANKKFSMKRRHRP
jgi:seryl-tRNA synthetase